jgi:hypothetical protein
MMISLIDNVAVDVNNALTRGDTSSLKSLLRNRRYDAPELFVLWQDAVINKQWPAVAQLFDHLSPHMRSPDGSGLVHLGVWAMSEDFLEQLFSFGMSANQQDFLGKTGLHRLAEGVCQIADKTHASRVLDMLLAHGADQSLKSHDGCRAGDRPFPMSQDQQLLFDLPSSLFIRSQIDSLRLNGSTGPALDNSEPNRL